MTRATLLRQSDSHEIGTPGGRMMVNEEADGVRALQNRVAALEAALKSFVNAAHGYTSGVRNGARWCSPRVSVEDMDRARELVPITTPEQSNAA